MSIIRRAHLDIKKGIPRGQIRVSGHGSLLICTSWSINVWSIRSAVDNMLDYKSRGRKIDSSFWCLSDETLNKGPMSVCPSCWWDILKLAADQQYF